MNREEFKEELKENMRQDLEIVEAKNQDYADGEDPFQNFRMVEDAGFVTVEEGIVVRLSDKMQRIMNLVQADEAAVNDESLTDTLSDARNYLNILQVYIENKRT